MKTIQTIILSVFAAATVGVTAQDYPDEYLGLPGDNLNLYAVMNLFQKSETLEGFERSLNDEESMMNNLDLNGDNLIDYITVSDYVEGNVHTIVLRASLDRNEQQDVAVFVVEKLRNGAVQIQLIGDQALYGPDYIVEPIYAETPNPGYTGQVHRRNVNVVTTTYYDIATWPLISYIYHPRYVVWRSSWYWGYYPNYWRPWRARHWHYYYGYHYHWHDHYYSHYRHWNRYRCTHYHTHYRNHVRVYSPTVVVNINKGRYRSTYSRPDQRVAGEARYRSAQRSGTVQSRQGVQRTNTSDSRTREGVSTNRRNTSAVRSTTGSRTTGTRSSTVRSGQQNSRSAVRTSSQRSSNQERVVSGQNGRSNSSKSDAVRQSSNKRSTPSVQRSSNKRGTPSVQRSSNKRSTPSVQRSSSKSSSKRSTPSVQRSSSKSSKSSSVKRSQSSRSKSSGQRSSSSGRKSSGSKKRSSSSRR